MVEVPADLLRDPAVSPHAKLIWLFLRRSGSARPSQLIVGAGMAPHTVRRCLAQLTAAGWAAPAPGGGAQACVPHTSGHLLQIPAELLASGAGVHSRLLYGLLQLLPGQFTYRELEQLAGVRRHTITRAVADLVRTGFLATKQQHQHAPFEFELLLPQAPPAPKPGAGLGGARRRIELAPHKGEQIMREWLSLLVDSRQFEDGAYFGWLINPLTGEQLQLDRFYSHPAPGVGFEFNGRQHDGPTELFPSEEGARQQRARDLMKIGLCCLKGIPVVIVQIDDLSLEGMRRKVGALLPLRDLSGQDRLIRFLQQKSQNHRENA